MRQKRYPNAPLYARPGRFVLRSNRAANAKLQHSQSDTNSTQLLLSVVTPIVTVYAVLSYVAGWSFLARYYD